MDYKIISEDVVFDDVFKIVRGHIKHDSLNDDKTVEIERLNFERDDSAAVIIYERDTDTVLFTNQFRYPTIKSGSGWLVEIPAGSINGREDPEANIIREVREEIGYHITQIKPIYTFFVSPGASSERIHLYFAEVSSGDRNSDGGGLESEGEDIQLLKIPMTKLLGMLQKGEIIDAKSIIGIQWLAGHKKNNGVL